MIVIVLFLSSIQQVLLPVMIDVHLPGLPDLSVKNDPAISAICSSSQAEVPCKHLMATKLGTFPATYFGDYASEVGSHDG